jgi:hypothetical protein
MRHRYIGGTVVAAVVALGWSSAVFAQEGGFQTPLNSEPVLPIPTGHVGEPGFYATAEYVMLQQTRAMGDQTIAVRGFRDTSGLISGVVGTFVGPGSEALNTRRMGQREFQPGFRTEIGYKFDTGTRLYANYMQVYDAHYSAGATFAPLAYRQVELSDTYLYAPVYNYHPAFVGPENDTAADTALGTGFNTVGIWNAAEVMDIKFTQRFQTAEVGMRVPLFESELSTVYGMAGGRFAWFFERFAWRTVDIANDGEALPQYVAWYSNTLSQRMYGLFVGCGHEVYLGNMFSASLDLTAAAFMDVIKYRAKYKLGDYSVQSKYGRESFSIVPSGTAEFNLWFYPTEGIQMRIGYMGMTFFNTRYMREPVGFNYGNIDPNYGVKWFRLVHGFNVGIGFFF